MGWMRYRKHLLKSDTTTSKCLVSDSSSDSISDSSIGSISDSSSGSSSSGTDEENSANSQTDLNSLQSV